MDWCAGSNIRGMKNEKGRGVKRRHAMPFGAARRDEGGVRFRLWAPGAQRVDLLLDDGHARPLQRADAGWFERIEPGAAAGSRYRYRIDDGLCVPDPASRYNPDDVHGPSQVIDPTAFDWQDDDWRGRPWAEAVIYELHVGSFTAAGSFTAVAARLDHLVDLGITAIELMPVADFPGQRNWGYDGVLPFAPDARYGTPDDLKRLVQAAHARGLMVLLDVVYNHFGPDGNYLHAYAPDFFNPAHHTPWGAAINFAAPTVRDFFIHNALYWLEEFHFDGLRLDAIHAIRDDNSPDIVEALTAAVRAATGDRHVHLVLENDRNEAHYLESRRWQDGGIAQWNDDIHHAFHVLLSGETDGYYADHADAPAHRLGRCLTSGFDYQGEPSPFRGGAARGEPSAQLPPGAFIDFLQTHDQIGNRACGERLDRLAPAAVDAALTVLLLAPQVPMLFMGEEFAAAQPFLFFCDFAANPELAQAVTAGRRREFAGFARFADPAQRERIPDPNAESSFTACVLDWSALQKSPHSERFARVRTLLALRQRHLVPLLKTLDGPLPAEFATHGTCGLTVRWHFPQHMTLHLAANLGAAPQAVPLPPQAGRLHACPTDLAAQAALLPPWAVAWYLTPDSTP
jgi:maltooligosyltrehalose trehalohydrolase